MAREASASEALVSGLITGPVGLATIGLAAAVGLAAGTAAGGKASPEGNS